jgi:hypothetical protein
VAWATVRVDPYEQLRPDSIRSLRLVGTRQPRPVVDPTCLYDARLRTAPEPPPAGRAVEAGGEGDAA